MADVLWREVTIETTPEELEAVTGRLTLNGVTGFVVEDEADFLTFLEENQQFWDFVDEELRDYMKGTCRVKCYVTDDADGEAQLKTWLTGITAPYTTCQLKEHDWATSWQKYYKPMSIGGRLYIVPEWERDEALPEGKIPLYLNPGLTFGTGSHASTRLCLEGIQEYIHPEDKVLDLGCGSGILSIAALILGGKTAMAVDIDPKAVGVAYENAALNDIGRDTYTVLAGNVLDDAPLVDCISETKYDLILINIVADVIIALAPLAKKLMAENATLVCSGIIDTRADDVANALTANGFTLTEKKTRDGWVSFIVK